MDWLQYFDVGCRMNFLMNPALKMVLSMLMIVWNHFILTTKAVTDDDCITSMLFV